MRDISLDISDESTGFDATVSFLISGASSLRSETSTVARRCYYTAVQY